MRGMHAGKRGIVQHLFVGVCLRETHCHMFVAWTAHSLEDKGSSLVKLGGYVLKKH